MNEIFLIFLTARRKAPDKLIEGTTLHQLPHGHVPLSFSPQFHDSTPPIESIVIPLKWKDIQYLHLFILLHPHTVFPIRRRRATTEGTSWFETHAHTLGNELWKGGGDEGKPKKIADAAKFNTGGIGMSGLQPYMRGSSRTRCFLRII
jgi:hypothetical protein